MYQVEKGIPVPDRKHIGKPARYPLREMKIGDSFLVPNKELGKHTQYGIRNSARYIGVKVTVRQVKGGIRAWRTK